MDRKCCFLFGHRDCPESMYHVLKAEVERHVVEFGVDEFVVGCYGHFDTMAAKAVIQTKKIFPHVIVTLLLPYHPSEYTPKTTMVFDGTLYPPQIETVPRRAAIVFANRYTVDHSDYVIAYAKYRPSNTYKLLEYAQSKQVKPHMTVL